MRRVIRAVRWIVVLVLLAALCGSAWAAWRLWAATPPLDGTVVVEGASAPVEIVRDEDGVPHIRASTEADALFGLGVAHAQDRLWQMEFQRRAGRGRLAEILGPDALRSDRFFRALDLPGVARENWPHLDPRTRALTEAYVAGVNAWIAHLPPRARPAEFALVGVAPAPFTREDVIIWSKVMALGLSTNWRDELLRARIAGRLGDEAAQALMPTYTAGAPIILPDGLNANGATAPASSAVQGASHPELSAGFLEAIERALPLEATGLAASNSWVLHGTRTTTGRPILANDPHLGARTPSVWYLAHVSGGPLDAIGATLPGLPSVVIGHNRRIAWGETNLMTDVQDLFVERVNARNEALFMGQWEPMRLRRDVIKVKGAPDEAIVVRSTRHGPILSDILPGAVEALALRWTALDAEDRTLDAFLGADTASHWSDFTAALSRVHVPMQNFVYADVDGNIGYYAPGAIPIRARGDGTRPVPGWSGDHEWTGYVPDDQVPRAFNPRQGYIATANNKALPDSYPHVISTNWDPGFRATRIVNMIERQAKHSTDDVASMQRDVQSAEATVLLPWLLEATPVDSAGSKAVERLRGWDRTVRADSAEAALFEEWKAAAARRLFADELGAELWAEYRQLPHWTAKALNRIALARDAAWCDDVRTEEREACPATLDAALADALADGAKRYGTADASRWQWGRANQVRFPHQPLDAVRVLRPFFSRTVEAGGDAFTVDPVMRIGSETVISSYRQIVDLSNLDASRFIHTLGQSGQLLTGRYDQYLEKWRKVEYVPMRFSRAAVDASAQHRLVLQPR